MFNTKLNWSILTQKEITDIFSVDTCMSCDNSWNVKGNGKYKKEFIGMSGKMDKEDKLKYTYILKCQCIWGGHKVLDYRTLVLRPPPRITPRDFRVERKGKNAMFLMNNIWNGIGKGKYKLSLQLWVGMWVRKK